MRSVRHNKCFRKSYSKSPLQKKDLLKDICNEYSLKRNNFNPADKSPNNFVKKLEIRMRLYYDQLKN